MKHTGQLPATTLEFPCEVQPEGTPLPTYWELYWKVIAAAVIWGVGTAAGEIPPYQFSYLAAVAGEANAELAAELEEAKNSDDMSLPYSVRKFNAMKAWMVDFIERRGFWGVYLMSAWPNAAFDLCGKYMRVLPCPYTHPHSSPHCSDPPFVILHIFLNLHSIYLALSYNGHFSCFNRHVLWFVQDAVLDVFWRHRPGQRLYSPSNPDCCPCWHFLAAVSWCHH